MPTATSNAHLPRLFRAGLLLVAVSALTGCSRESRPPVHPVRGSVTFQKKPATKAVVVLRPLAPGPLKDVFPHGEVGPDGTFQIGTFAEGDGAPAGEYAVTITWPETTKDRDGVEVTGGDRLNGRYSDPAKSKWKVTIKEGSNELEPFRLD